MAALFIGHLIFKNSLIIFDTLFPLLAQLGSAEITSREIVRAIYPKLAEKQGDEIDEKRAVIGLDADQQHRRAKCCQPVPGERIIGITYRGQGVVVHAIDCEALADYVDKADRGQS